MMKLYEASIFFTESVNRNDYDIVKRYYCVAKNEDEAILKATAHCLNIQQGWKRIEAAEYD